MGWVTVTVTGREQRRRVPSVNPQVTGGFTRRKVALSLARSHCASQSRRLTPAGVVPVDGGARASDYQIGEDGFGRNCDYKCGCAYYLAVETSGGRCDSAGGGVPVGHADGLSEVGGVLHPKFK